jgi:hypothetical protein
MKFFFTISTNNNGSYEEYKTNVTKYCLIFKLSEFTNNL